MKKNTYKNVKKQSRKEIKIPPAKVEKDKSVYSRKQKSVDSDLSYSEE